MAALRDADEPVPGATVSSLWPETEQRERALAGLLDDGLAVRLPDGRVSLPH